MAVIQRFKFKTYMIQIDQPEKVGLFIFIAHAVKLNDYRLSEKINLKICDIEL